MVDRNSYQLFISIYDDVDSAGRGDVECGHLHGRDGVGPPDGFRGDGASYMGVLPLCFPQIWHEIFNIYAGDWPDYYSRFCAACINEFESADCGGCGDLADQFGICLYPEFDQHWDLRLVVHSQSKAASAKQEGASRGV